jgi:hypothetical protein
MKKSPLIFAALMFCLCATPSTVPAQTPGGTVPRMDASMMKLFGNHQAFSATVEIQMPNAQKSGMAMSGRMSLYSGRSRFELNFAEMKNSGMSAEEIAQMKAMGMDRMVSIVQTERKMMLIVYPSLESYVEMPMPAGTSPEDCKAEITKTGTENMDGHSCVKNKVVVTTSDGKKVEATVWNATDLEDFPVRVETTDSGAKIVMLFKNVSFSAPDESFFEAPAGYRRYTNIQAMMQTEIMKRMQAAGAADE